MLDENPDAAALNATLNARNRYALAFRLKMAKRAETRTRRLTEFTRMLKAGESLGQRCRSLFDDHSEVDPQVWMMRWLMSGFCFGSM